MKFQNILVILISFVDKNRHNFEPFPDFGLNPLFTLLGA